MSALETQPYDAHPGTTKRALIAEMRQARSFLSGAITLLKEGEEDTADIALWMAEEAVGNARGELALRSESGSRGRR